MVDIHPTVTSGENPDGSTMRILARSEYREFVRLTDQEWTHEEAQKSEMADGVRDALCEALRHSGPLKNRDGEQALLMDCGGWANFHEVAGLIGVRPIDLFWEVCCDRMGLFQLATSVDDVIIEEEYRYSPPQLSGRLACPLCRSSVPGAVWICCHRAPRTPSLAFDTPRSSMWKG